MGKSREELKGNTDKNTAPAGAVLLIAAYEPEYHQHHNGTYYSDQEAV